jgi:DNA repair exonuclease SbcCD ATPase subunit
MIEALGATLKNVVYFKEGAIDYTDNCGLVVVSGKNLDSRISKKQNNGAGKSLSFSILPNILYESTPLASQKRVRKDIMGTGSEATFSVRAAGHEWKVIQTPSKYIIEKDGVDQQVRGLAAQREMIQGIFPLTEDEFYSYVYLQSQRPLDFQIGTPRSRLAYITKVWRLDHFDVMRKYFDKRLSDIKTAKTEFDVLTNELIQINKSLDKLKWSAKKQEKLDAATEIVNSLSSKVKGLQADASKLRAAKEQIDFYNTTLQAYQKAKNKVRWDKSELKEQRELLRAFEKYEEQLVTYQKQVKRWTAKLEEIGECSFDADDKEKLRKTKHAVEKNQERLQEMKAGRRKHAELMEAFEELPKPSKNVGLKEFRKLAQKTGKDVAEIFEEEMGILNSTLSLEDLVHDHADDGKCPTCLQGIDVAKLKKNIQRAKKRKAELKELVREHKADVERKRIKDALAKLDFSETVYKALKDKTDHAKGKIEELEERKANARRWDEWTEELKSIKKPKEPKGTRFLTEEKLEKQFEYHAECKRLQERLEEFDEPPTADGIDSKLKKIEKKLSAVETEYSDAFSITADLGNKRSEYKLLTKQAKKLNVKLEGMRPFIEKRDMFKALINAYGNKGLKLQAAQEVLYQLERNLNRFATLIFAEPFKFTVETKNDGVHVKVDRGHNKISDIRQLSGAESDAFRLLYMLSSLVMVKDDRRTNFVVLDEPDAHMDDVTRGLFIERYLPFLRTLVPHVFLITPKSQHAYSNCDYITIVKKGGVSRIVKGQAA